jgi:hypothetical protein
VRKAASYLLIAFALGEYPQDGVMLLVCVPIVAWATKLASLRPIDEKCLYIEWHDGTMEYEDNGTETIGNLLVDGTGNADRSISILIPHGSPPGTSAATSTRSYTLTSSDDSFYSGGKQPSAVHRKEKVWGVVTYKGDECAKRHYVYLELPDALDFGATYALEISSNTNTDVTTKTFTFDEFDSSCVSPAIHISNLGYQAASVYKSSDVFQWMGSGGGRNY